jgi:geranylgeranyl reductase family protein
VIYDVIIVGAGPAGSVLAYQLASCGLCVHILEKERLPRYKICGGGLTYKAIQSLPVHPGGVVEKEAAGGILAYKGQQLLKIDTARPIACLVMRDRFDYFLVQQAVQAGAQLSEGQTVKRVESIGGYVLVTTNHHKKYRCWVLVGADGVNSMVARSVGLLTNRKKGVAVEAELMVPPAVLDRQGHYATFDFGALPYGYGWIFPKRDHLSVGVFQAKPGKALKIRSHFRDFIANHKLHNEHTQLSFSGHHIPLGGQETSLQRGQVLLVGDAANLADPWLGEGLYYAIKSANIAARVILDAFKVGSLKLDDYDTQIGVEILPQLFYARIFAWWVYHMPRLGIFLTRKSETMQDAVFGAMRGDLTFQALISRLALGLPRILLQALGRRVTTPAYRAQS